MQLRNVVFPQPDGAATLRRPKVWDVELVGGVITSIKAAGKHGDADGSDTASVLLVPPLCHPHLHLDKAYLLTSSGGGAGDGRDDDPDYSDLLPQTGTFEEALHTTAVAKSRFTAADLRRRGLQLLATSCAQGVTSARVFVEVDAAAAGQGTVAVAVARELQTLFGSCGRLALQVCAFAQEALFTGAAGAANRAAMEAVLAANRSEAGGPGGHATISVLGVTPYVEESRQKSLQNIDWAVATALEYDLHLDLHLDYNLKDCCGSSSSSGGGGCTENEPLVFALVDALVRHNWTRQSVNNGAAHKQPTRPKTVVVGHATQLTRLPQSEMARLAAMIRKHRLPLSFVGLPTSDLYMMGRRPAGKGSLGEPYLSCARGTLPVPALIREFGLAACLGVNNVGNAFTPYGTGDPLQLACWGVGLYHAGTGQDAHLLYGSVSWRARAAIGIDDGDYGDESSDDGDAVDWEKPLDCPQEQLLGKRMGSLLAIVNKRFIELPPTSLPEISSGSGEKIETTLSRIPARPRLGFRDIVWDPPDTSLRKVVYDLDRGNGTESEARSS
ncbi:hypothetical protein SEPCBS119000_000667 [Sporothrix epigloea]|uniref:Zinc metallopeptidase n=1 Tax=Sporothrix epigloea TaxID=1892477 RepID=A0ABP0D6F8_9PEZI